MRIRIAMASAALALAMGSGAADAHALLKAAVPTVGSTIPASPPEVALDFSEDVEPAFSTIVLQDPAGHPVKAGPVHLASGQGNRLILELPSLPPGTYKVIWHATSVDTHKTQGSFSFTIKP
jgi:methionine-rich copper-binding protein CopC